MRSLIEKTVGLFTESAVESVASDDPARIAPLGVFTYQVIATKDHANEDFWDAARLFRISQSAIIILGIWPERREVSALLEASSDHDAGSNRGLA